MTSFWKREKATLAKIGALAGEILQMKHLKFLKLISK